MPDEQGKEQQPVHTFEEHNKGPLPPLGGTRDFDPYSGYSYFPPDTKETVQTPAVKQAKDQPVTPTRHNAVEDDPNATRPAIPRINLPIGSPEKGLLAQKKR